MGTTTDFALDFPQLQPEDEEASRIPLVFLVPTVVRFSDFANGVAIDSLPAPQ